MKADEWQAFKSLRLAALERDGNQFGQSYETVKEYSDDRWQEEARKAAQSDEFFIILAFDGTRPVGMSGCVRTKDFGKIIAVWVESAYRGRGIGRLVVQAAMDIVGAARYRLSVVAGNEPAIRTYERLGFAPTGFTYVNHKGFTEIEMEFNTGSQ